MTERRSSGDIIVDRRRASRIPLRLAVEFAHQGAEVRASARNLTRFGIFVETEQSVPAGASLEMKLFLSDDPNDPAKVAARVTRPARRADERPGFAADFESLDEATVERIAALLKRGSPDSCERG